MAFLNNSFSFDLGLTYYNAGGEYISDGIQTSIDIGYLRPSLKANFLNGNSRSNYRAHIGGGLGLGFSLSASQMTNGVLYDLKANNAIGNDLHWIINLGIRIKPSESIGFEFAYFFERIIANIEEEINQQANLFIHGITTKISFDL